ncbi:MAG: hypothetical protein ABI747_02060 [Candidatus Moraniibacteriota bacterium]
MHAKRESFEKKKIPSFLKKNIADILVASHTHEPYVIVFRYSGDNVAADRLGTFVGFFEVEIHDEDAAYIVNFLASVAKKEYFANIRRGPIESFEAALHKVNVALSELVKHGNVSWLGRLNGALAILVGNTLHFSVTGEGTISLFRGGMLRNISNGLTDDESEPHPLKTFVEVASGDLFSGDRVFLLSPSVWTLFTPADIEKNATRFSPEALERFLRTALVNELDSAATVLITCEEAPEIKTPSAKPAEEKAPKELSNVFSEELFREEKEKARERALILEKSASDSPEKESEFIDTKTGHIYVQGEAMENQTEEPWRQRLAIMRHTLGTAWHHFLQKFSRTQRKWKKDLALGSMVLGERLGSGARSLGRKSRSLTRRAKMAWQKAAEKRRAKQSEKAADRPMESPLPVSPSFPQENGERASSLPSGENAPELPDFLARRLDQLKKVGIFQKKMQEESSVETEPSSRLPLSPRLWPDMAWFGPFLKKLKVATIQGTEALLQGGSHISAWLGRMFVSPEKMKVTLSLFLIIVVSSLAWFFWPKNETVPAPRENPSASQEMTAPWPPQDEKGAVELGGKESLITLPENETLIATFFLRETPFAVTSRSIINLNTNDRTTSNDTLQRAATMDDLSAIFLQTESGSVLTYTPSNKKFASNILPLPEGVKVNALATYLTYLYILDESAGKIYRFPRAEGGFGTPISWLKESVSLSLNTRFAVEDVVTLASNNTVRSFTKGKTAVSEFEKPKNEFFPIDMTLLPESNEVYVLDPKNERVIQWKKEGALAKQYFSHDLKDALNLAVSPDQKTLLIGGSAHEILRFILP